MSYMGICFDGVYYRNIGTCVYVLFLGTMNMEAIF